MANLTMDYKSLYNLVARFLWKTQPGKWMQDIDTKSSDTQTTIIKNICARGYRNFLYPIDERTGKEYLWTFLKQHYTINLINEKWKYALPENFSEILTEPSFSDEDGYISLTRVSPEKILDMRVAAVETIVPSYYAIAPSNYDLETGTFYEFWVHGQPNSTYTIQFFYKINPLKPEATSDYLVGGIKAIEAITENCLAVAEQQELNTFGIHTQLAKKLTQDLIRIDGGAEAKTVLGNLHPSYREDYIVRGENAKFWLTNLWVGEGYVFDEPT